MALVTLQGSPAQLEALDALVEHGTIGEAAAARGWTRYSVEDRIKRLRQRNDMTTVQLAYQRGRDRAILQLTLWLDIAA